MGYGRTSRESVRRTWLRQLGDYTIFPMIHGLRRTILECGDLSPLWISIDLEPARKPLPVKYSHERPILLPLGNSSKGAKLRRG
jgi:hypothetical protein